MTDRYHNGAYLKDNPGWHAQDAGWKLTHVLSALKKSALPETIQSVADVGCGAGEVIKRWASLCPDKHFTGYEISPQAQELCRQNAPANTVFKTHPDGQKFDLALALDVLEHVPDYSVFLKDLAALAPYAVLHVPLDLALRTVIKPEVLAEVYTQVGHLHYFTAPFLRRVLARNGWEVVYSCYTNKYLDFPPAQLSVRSRLGLLIRRLAHYGLPRAWAAWLVGGYSLLLVVRRKN